MKKYYPKFEEGKFYHIYNRGNNGDNIFFKEMNYSYFLRKYDRYLSDLIDTMAYCLLPNHFHLLIRVRWSDSADLNKSVSEGFRRFFIAYSQAINKQEGRTGSLFQKNLKRIEIEKNDYISQLILYLHLNPVKHNITSDFESYSYSSFRSLLSTKPTRLMREEVLDWFGGVDAFIEFHKCNLETYTLKTDYEM